MYLYGEEKYNIESNYEKALAYINKAVAVKEKAGIRLLGICYEFGAGVEVDNKKAFELYSQAADYGDGIAQYKMATFYIAGKVVEKNYHEALNYVNAAVKNEISQAYELAGDFFYYGMGIDRDFKRALDWYQLAAENGEWDAYEPIGNMYMNGWGVEADGKKATDYFQKGAELGNIHCLALLAYCYETGKGVKQDVKKAVEYYKQVENRDNGYANYSLYRIYRSQEYGLYNADDAISCLRAAVDKGYAEAVYLLGMEYFYGDILQQNMEQAKEYILKAAEEEEPTAAAFIGIAYYNNTSFPIQQDDDKASNIFLLLPPIWEKSNREWLLLSATV